MRTLICDPRELVIQPGSMLPWCGWHRRRSS